MREWYARIAVCKGELVKISLLQFTTDDNCTRDTLTMILDMFYDQTSLALYIDMSAYYYEGPGPGIKIREGCWKCPHN